MKKKITKEAPVTSLMLSLRVMTLMDENRNLAKAVQSVTDNMHAIIRGANEANMELAKKMQALEAKVSDLEKVIVKPDEEVLSNFSDNQDHDA